VVWRNSTATAAPVAGLAVVLVALLGIVVNVLASWVLAKAGRSSLNVAAHETGAHA
jgi:Co/Zn/Cd efflux system component